MHGAEIAFPFGPGPELLERHGYPLDKREYFACKMLAAIVASEGAVGKWPDGHDGPAKESIRRQDARRACLYADALIEALNEKPDANQT